MRRLSLYPLTESQVSGANGINDFPSSLSIISPSVNFCFKSLLFLLFLLDHSNLFARETRNIVLPWHKARIWAVDFIKNSNLFALSNLFREAFWPTGQLYLNVSASITLCLFLFFASESQLQYIYVTSHVTFTWLALDIPSSLRLIFHDSFWSLSGRSCDMFRIFVPLQYWWIENCKLCG